MARRRAEWPLNDTEKRLQRVISGAPVIVWAVDGLGVVRVAQGSGLQAFQLTSDMVVGKSAYELFRDVPEALVNLDRALAGETFVAVVEACGRFLEVHCSPERNESGRIVGTGGITLDVTQHRKAEAALRRAESHVSRIISGSPLVLWAVDFTGALTLVEGAGLAGLGLTSEQLKGGNVFELFADVPEGLDRARRALRGEASVLDTEIRGRAYVIHYFADRDAGGQIVGASGLAQDVTDARHAERQLRTSEERFHQLAEQLSIGLWFSTPDLKEVLYRNPRHREIYQHSSDDLSSVDARLQAVHPDDRARIEEEFHSWPPEAPKDLIYRVVRPDGSVRWVRDRCFAIRDKAGVTTQVAGLVEDITELRHLEVQARRAQDRLADAQRVAHVGNWDWEIVTNDFWWSEEVYRIFGREPADESVTLESFLGAVHVDDFATVSQAMATACAEGTSLDIVHRISRPGNGIRIVHMRGEVTMDASGRPVRMLGTLQDLTESQATQEALAMLSSAVEQAADLVFITGPEGRIRYVNPAFEAHTGYSLQEALGATPSILRPETAPSSDYDQVWQTLLEGQIYRGVLVNQKKGGELFFEEKTITPIRDSQGRTTHFVSVGRDITERMEAEAVRARLQKAVAKAAGEWRTTFDSVETPLVLVDAHGLVKRVNRAARELLALDYEAIVGRPIPGDRGEPWETMTKAVEAMGPGPASVTLSSDGGRRTWDVVASPVPGPEGEGSRIVMARDISKMVELQKSLRRSELMSAMGTLVAGVAHEVRNPLFGISAALDAFESDFSDRDEYREYAMLLRAEVGRLNDLMQSLLEYGHPSSTVLVDGQVGDVIRRAIRACTPIATRSRVTVVDAAGELPAVRMDAGRLVQVFQNLIENAIQHAPPGSEVRVSAERSREGGADSVVCVTSDSGPGFRPEDLSSVFEPFFTRRRGGTGLGLSIVQKIVEEHGGSIFVANRREGGAAVTLTLPSAAPEPTVTRD